MARRIGKKTRNPERRELFRLLRTTERKPMSSETQSPIRKGATQPKAPRRPCEHVWEYASGPDHAANFLCSRCETEMVAPVKQAQPR